MALLTNPNLAYVLVVVGITLIFLANLNSQSPMLIIGLVLCLIAAVLGFLYLRINLWAFLVVASSPLLFVSAVRQARPQYPLAIISIFMLAIGSFFLFVDPDYQPLTSNRWAWVSVLSATILWMSIERLRNVAGVKDPDSVVGLIGETITDIETHSAGQVLIEGELWLARSKEPISAGSTVRVLRQDGFWLTVKQAKKLPKR